MKHIRIVSPSGAIEPQYIDTAAERLRGWGYRVSVAPHAYDVCGRFAGSDAARAEDVIGSLTEADADIVLCSRGGYGLQRIVEPIARALAIAQGPLPLVVGFSDITVLHRLMARHGAASLHAVMCKHIATLPDDAEPLVQLRHALEGETLRYALPSHPLNRYPAEPVKGRLLGGNLSVLYGLQGTPLALPQGRGEGRILLIEDIGERHYHIDRMMRNLRLSGALEGLSAMLVGQFSDCDADPKMVSSGDRAQSVYETILEAVADYDYPVLFDVPCGHVAHNLPFLLEGTATLSYSEGRVLLSQEGLSR